MNDPLIEDSTFDFEGHVAGGGRFVIDPQFSLKEPRTILVIEYHDPEKGWLPVKWWPAAGVPRTLENARAMIAKATIPEDEKSKTMGFQIIQRTFISEERVIDQPTNGRCACLGQKGCYCRPLTEGNL